MNNNIFKIEDDTLVDVLDKNITEAVIPNNVSHIGRRAFINCTSLKSVTIPNSVTWIGNRAFEGCTSLINITIPDSVTSISSSVVFGCISLKSVTIPNSVKSIGYDAFSGCTSLINITIPDSVISIGKWAFLGNESLTSITIGNSVTSICNYAFAACKSLTSVIIPNSVISIGDGVFSNCKSLQSKTSNYKAFSLKDENLVCRDYQFTPNEWSKEEFNIIPCERGYHYCTNLFEIFNYYSGELDKDITIYECEVGDEVIKTETSKCCTNKIKPVKRLYREDIIKLLNG